jgi:hypothetical protein
MSKLQRITMVLPYGSNTDGFKVTNSRAHIQLPTRAWLQVAAGTLTRSTIRPTWRSHQIERCVHRLWIEHAHHVLSIAVKSLCSSWDRVAFRCTIHACSRHAALRKLQQHRAGKATPTTQVLA